MVHCSLDNLPPMDGSRFFFTMFSCFPSQRQLFFPRPPPLSVGTLTVRKYQHKVRNTAWRIGLSFCWTRQSPTILCVPPTRRAEEAWAVGLPEITTTFVSPFPLRIKLSLPDFLHNMEENSCHDQIILLPEARLTKHGFPSLFGRRPPVCHHYWVGSFCYHVHLHN